MKRRKMQQENIFSTSGSKWKLHWISARETSMVFILWACIPDLRNKIIANVFKIALKIYIYLLQQFHVSIQLSLMLLQYSVSIIYSFVQNSSKLWWFPFVSAREAHQSRGQWHRQGSESVTDRFPSLSSQELSLSETQKQPLLDGKWKKVGIYLDESPKTSLAIAEPRREAREGMSGISPLLH